MQPVYNVDIDVQDAQMADSELEVDYESCPAPMRVQ